MMVRDELVEAIAQAICRSRTVDCRGEGCCGFYEHHARIALDTLLAVLPDPPTPPEICCPESWRDRLCSHHQGFKAGWESLRKQIGDAR